MKLNSDLILEFEESDCSKWTFDFGTEKQHTHFLYLEHANKLLNDEMMKWPLASSYGDTGHVWNGLPDPDHTHRTRILPPQPIKQDSHKDIVMALANIGLNDLKGLVQLAERARKALE